MAQWRKRFPGHDAVSWLRVVHELGAHTCQGLQSRRAGLGEGPFFPEPGIQADVAPPFSARPWKVGGPQLQGVQARLWELLGCA